MVTLKLTLLKHFKMYILLKMGNKRGEIMKPVIDSIGVAPVFFPSPDKWARC